MRPALVTDSNAQLSDELRDRYDVRVVPVPVVVNGQQFLEGVDLDADDFYAFFADGTPQVTTSQPSPGAFVEVYQACVDAGHDEIISIHLTEAMSGTLNSARIAADLVDAQIMLVDSQTASFGISCCVWRAGQVLEAGGSSEQAVAAAQTHATQLSSVTALGAAELLQNSGRVELQDSQPGVGVFRSDPDGSFTQVGAGKTVDEVCDLMAATMHRDGADLRVALGIADATAMPYHRGLEARLKARSDVIEIVEYRIGPSVGAFTGPGTAGGFWYPAQDEVL